MDKITKSYVDDFLKLNEIASEGEAKDFEKFVNYSIVTDQYNATFDINDISTGNSAQGIDGIAILVNGKLVTSSEHVADLINMNKFIEVSFIFIQSKTSFSFEGTEIGNLFFSIKNFFSDQPSILTTDELHNFHEIVQKIFEFSPRMTKGKPELKIYFATTGIWKAERPLVAVSEAGIEELKRTNYFGTVDFFPIDGNRIQTLYRKTKEVSTATFTFKDKVTLPDIEGVNEAYFGILSWAEFKKIILNENGTIKNIFYDNVRDYLGDNAVNDSINNTIKNGKFDLFSVLNNGVTLVATKLHTAGNKFTISDYQVVNGCQTSHVLFSNKDEQGIENINIPLRLISTDNEDVKNEITIATNNQTAVKPEQLAALSEFQKNLEEYYKTFEEEFRLYYERRTNQFNSDSAVLKSKIVSIPHQIKTFSSMFLDLPHAVSGYFGTIMRNHGDNIFISGQSYFPYYISALTFYKLETFFKTGQISTEYKKAKYHLLMLFKKVIDPMQPQLNSRKIDIYCQKIFDILKDNNKTLKFFNNAIAIVDASEINIEHRSAFKSGDTTHNLLKLADYSK